MSLLESLPTEILYSIMGYINRIKDLKSICLTSKRLSAFSTPILYRDLIIMDDFYNHKKMWQIVKEIKKGKNLQYVRTLYVGECNMETADDWMSCLLPSTIILRIDSVTYLPTYLNSQKRVNQNISVFIKKESAIYIMVLSLSLYYLIHQISKKVF